MKAIICAFLVCACVAIGCKRDTKHASGGENTGKLAILSEQHTKDSAFTMRLDTDPSQPRFGRKTRFTVKVTDSSGKPVSGAQAHISLVMPLMDMGKNEIDLKPAADGTYQGVGEFTMAGEWEVVTTAAANGKNAKYTFNIKVEE